MIAGRKTFQHRRRLDRGYLMQKLLGFLRERETPAFTILTILNDAADQLPKTARAEEAQLRADIQGKAANSRRTEPQELGCVPGSRSRAAGSDFPPECDNLNFARSSGGRCQHERSITPSSQWPQCWLASQGRIETYGALS